MVQIVSGDTFQAQAENQYTEGASYFDRGTIYFTDKDGGLVPGASIKTGYILYINPTTISAKGNAREVYEKLSAITPIDRSAFFVKVNKKSDPYEEVAKKLDKSVSDQIRALKLTGVGTSEERWRSYPGGETASHTLGLVGYSGDELAGRYGLERYYEKMLGRNGDDVFVNFFAEIFSNIKSATGNGEELEADIVTTIEPSVQTYLESEIEKVTGRYSSDFTGGIVIDPNNGEIVAMALTPDFDPNSPQSEKNAAVFRNKLVEDRYEMGSILKAITLAIGLDKKVITSKSVFNDPGCMTLNTKTFCNYDGKSHGTSVSMQTVLNKSLNTGAAVVVSRVGSGRFSESMLAFGLSTTTGIDLPSEGKSLVSNLGTNRDLELAQASFGQGIALTPIQTVKALSALANGGTLITPHLVKEVQYKIGLSDTIEYPEESERQRAISKEASIEISKMLTEVVDRSLRDGNVRLENHSVAAKTGTAQIARSGGGGYYEDRYLHSFFGYFPSYEARYLVFLYTYNPKGVNYASETLTDTFINMTKFLINYYNIAPDRQAPPQGTL